MVPKTIFSAVIGATLLAWSSLAAADEHRPGEFFSLNLSQAVLSPKPLGPPAQFVPGPIEPGADPAEVAQVSPEPEPEPEPKPTAAVAAPRTRVAHLRAEKPRAAVRARVARRHTNPLDAQAFDTRIQVWPCRSGGICNWQPSRR
jgi:hypothetical protein